MNALPLYLALVTGQTTKRADVRLVDLTPVTQVAKYAIFKMSKEFSVGGVVIKEGIQLLPQGSSSPDRSGRLVYSIPRGMQIFRGQFGVPDTDADGTGEASLEVFIDGESAQVVKGSAGSKPAPFEVNLKSAHSIMFQFTGVSSIGSATFSASANSGTKPSTKPQQPAMKPEPAKPVVNPAEMPRVNLVEPENGKLFNNTVVIKWEAIPNAISYGVEIVMITNANPKKIPSRFIRAFSAKSETFEWNLSDDVLSGEYQVSIIAFGKEGVLSKFSNSRRFKVERK